MKPNIEKIKQNKTTEELLEFGIINIDKSSGPTSFQISEFVKKKLNLRKTSHFGTLDPKVTGVLPVALNRACKLSGYFLGEDKTYVGIARFHEEVKIEEIQKKINEKFIGKIIQTPPLKSRVKRQPRPRKVYSFDILEKDEKDFLFKVKCEGGTYIRKLIDDLGNELGTGAHMLELRRTNAGIFFENDKSYPSINLYDFEKSVEEYTKGNDSKLREIIIPAEVISELFPTIELREERKKEILHGKKIVVEDLLENLPKEELVCLFSKDQFLGVFKQISKGKFVLKSDFTLQPIE